MNKEKHFLEAINKGEPNADLIYADWLEEQGNPEADEIKDPTIVVLFEWLVSRCWSIACLRSQSGSCSRVWPRSWSRSQSRFGSQVCAQSRSNSRSGCWSRSWSRSWLRSRSTSLSKSVR